MIRFSAALVTLSLGVLAAGAATSRLLLVYVAIGGSALALVCLGLGVVVKRGELFGESSRGTGVSDQGRALVGFGADGFSPADRAPAFSEQQRGPRSSAPGHRPLHASGQSGRSGQSGGSPDDRARVAAGSGRPPGDRQETDWQDSPRDTWSRARRESQGQRIGPQREAEAAAEMRATDHRSADARGSDVRASVTWQSDARGTSAPEWTPTPSWQARPPVPPASGMPPGRPQRPAQFPGESPVSTPPFGSTGPDASRPRHDTPGPSRPEPSRGEPSRPEPPRGEPSRPEPPRGEPSRPEPPRGEPSRPEPPRGEPSRPQGPGQQTPWSQAPRPEQPAAFWGGTPGSSASRSGDIPPPVEPIYPAGKPQAASGGERQEKAPKPAEPQGWFYRAPDNEDRAAEPSAEEKPRAAADGKPRAGDQTQPAGEPAAGAATRSGAQARTGDSGAPGTATARSGTGEAGDKPQRGKQGSADADSAGSGDRPGASSPRNGDGPPPDREVTIVPGVPRYHRPGCSTIRFMDEGDLEKRTLKSAAEAGCAPCEVCQADAADPAPAGG